MKDLNVTVDLSDKLQETDREFMKDLNLTVDATDELRRKTSRRNALGASALATAIAAMWRPRSAEAKGGGGSLVLDVACLGDAFAANIGGALNLPAGDLRGISFCVEGLIYPAWTIPTGVVFNLEQAPPAIGTWFCRGWFISHPGRLQPYTNTIQDFVLEPPTNGNLSRAADKLVSAGPDFGAEGDIRSVIGGTGKYRGALGEETIEIVGANQTILPAVFGGVNAPTFRMQYNLGDNQ